MRFALFSLLLPLLLASPSSQIPAVTRGAFVSMLWEQAGGVPYDATPVFSDVDRDGPWATAVAWAAARGLILGNGSGRFEPERPITWEEAALILRRWQALYGRDVPLSVGHVACSRSEGASPWSAASLYRTAGRFASMLPQLSSCTPYKRPDRRPGLLRNGSYGFTSTHPCTSGAHTFPSMVLS